MLSNPCKNFFAISWPQIPTVYPDSLCTSLDRLLLYWNERLDTSIQLFDKLSGSNLLCYLMQLNFSRHFNPMGKISCNHNPINFV